jgi:hypothetical protein
MLSRVERRCLVSGGEGVPDFATHYYRKTARVRVIDY